MKYIQLILLFVTFSIAISCNTVSNNKITNKKDYNTFLETSKNVKLTSKVLDTKFWQEKINKAPTQYPYYAKLASSNSQLFSITGNIDELKNAEENLIEANERTNYNNAGYLRSLSRNYISQHRFKEALELLTKAEYIGSDINATQGMLFDVYLELGSIEKAEAYLTKIKNFKSFDYLIRISKYNDHIGNLDNAIKYLEQSLVIAESSKRKSLIQWNYTNLADYYGHAGRIKDSYNSFLKALEIDNNNAYAMKGIAWIVYSYERNPVEALRILDSISKKNESPDYYLLKSEIADYIGDETLKEENIKKYISKIENIKYGVMYQKYNALLYSENSTTVSKAIKIAEQEIAERPTTQSYDLLAWAYYKKGDKKKALSIAEKFVLNKTFEPEALLHSAFILKANGRVEEANNLKVELLEAIYELGPLSEKEIRNI